MKFRTKLFVAVALAVLAGTAWAAWSATRYTRGVFARYDRQRSDALVGQFQKELAQRGQEVITRVQDIANSEGTLRMALQLSSPGADPSLYVNDALGLAQSHRLDFVELVGNDGTVISSAQWPGRVGYKDDWVTKVQDWKDQGAFLRPVQLADNVELGLMAVRVVTVGSQNLYVIAGERFDRGFLNSLAVPPETRVLLYRNLETAYVPTALAGVNGPVARADQFAPLITAVQQQRRELRRTIQWGLGPGSDEAFTMLPLTGRQKDLLGIVLVGTTQRDAAAAVSRIRTAAVGFAVAGIVFAFLLSGWASRRVSRPLGRLTGAMRDVAAGKGAAEVRTRSRDEAGQLARAFNDMNRRLGELRGRLVQSERTAARREVARRVEQELKDPLFPLQLTVENLRRAREQTAERFDEIFFESLDALHGTIEALKTSVARFSDFAKMPTPRLQPLNVNEMLRAALNQFEPQFSAIGRPPINPELFLDESLPHAQADPEELHQALEALLLRSIESMPSGGTITVRTTRQNGMVRVEISDTGGGLKPEECERLFTSFYATRQHGRDLGLATVQAVVQEHGGRIWVESAPGAGTTFRMDLPVAAAATGRAEARAASWPERPAPGGARAEGEPGTAVPSVIPSTRES